VRRLTSARPAAQLSSESELNTYWRNTAWLQSAYSVVFPSKCSSEASASAFVARTIPSLIGRPIEGVKPQWLVAAVDDVVTGSSGYQDCVVALDAIPLPVDHDFALAHLYSKKLIAIRMDLLTDLLAGLERHQHQLKVLARIEDMAEITIILSQLLDVFDEAFHRTRPVVDCCV
jgi:hypothetical protein